MMKIGRFYGEIVDNYFEALDLIVIKFDTVCYLLKDIARRRVNV